MQIVAIFQQYSKIIQQQGQIILSGISICTGITYIITLSDPSTTGTSFSGHYYLDSKTVLLIMISISSFTALILLLARLADMRLQPAASSADSSLSTTYPPSPHKGRETPHALPVSPILLALTASREEKLSGGQPAPIPYQECTCMAHELVQNQEQLT